MRNVGGGGSTWRLERGMLALMIVQAVVYAVYYAIPGARKIIVDHIALTPHRVIPGLELWQPLTALFTNLATLPFVLDMVFTWLMGSFIERAVGKRQAIVLFVGTGTAGYFAAALLGLALGRHDLLCGAGPALFALMAATGFLFGRTQVLLFGAMPARADVISWIFVGAWLIRRILYSEFTLLMADVAAGAVAWLLIRGGIPSLGKGAMGGKLHRARLWWLRRRYKVLEGGKGKSEKKWMN